MNMKLGLAALVLTVPFVASGCTTTQVVRVQPNCSNPTVGALPAIDRGALWDAVGDEEYRKYERYIDALWANIDEKAAILESVCANQRR